MSNRGVAGLVDERPILDDANNGVHKKELPGYLEGRSVPEAVGFVESIASELFNERSHLGGPGSPVEGALVTGATAFPHLQVGCSISPQTAMVSA